MIRAILGNAGFYIMTKGVVAVRFLGLFLGASVRGTSEARCVVLAERVYNFVERGPQEECDFP